MTKVSKGMTREAKYLYLLPIHFSETGHILLYFKKQKSLKKRGNAKKLSNLKTLIKFL